MRIAHLTFTVDTAATQQALATLVAAAPSVRAMPGCHAFLPFADPTVEGGLGLIHEWESADAFASYLASPGFAQLNAALRPLMTAPPLSKRFEAEPVCDAACQAA